MKNTTRFAAGRRFEVASIGRLAVDLYANQYGCDLEEVSTFAKYLGGSHGESITLASTLLRNTIGTSARMSTQASARSWSTS